MYIDQRDQAEPAGGRRTGRHRASGATLIGLTVAFCAVLVMRNDWWNWSSVEPLLFGFLPVGLWWQAVVSISASVLLALCVRLAWPWHLEDVQPEGGRDVEAGS